MTKPKQLMEHYERTRKGTAELVQQAITLLDSVMLNHLLDYTRSCSGVDWRGTSDFGNYHLAEFGCSRALC